MDRRDRDSASENHRHPATRARGSTSGLGENKDEESGGIEEDERGDYCLVIVERQRLSFVSSCAGFIEG